jgi:16S rRNA processing protein RimM
MITDTKENVCIAKIVGAHGVHGSVRVYVISDNPECLLDYKRVKDTLGKTYTVKKLRIQKGNTVIVKFEELHDRNEAEAARGTELFIPRELMPDLEEDEFYITDLVGLKVRSLKGDEIGFVKAVENHGAGDLLIIDPYLKLAFPFTRSVIPEVHVRDGYIVLDEHFLTLDLDA